MDTRKEKKKNARPSKSGGGGGHDPASEMFRSDAFYCSFLCRLTSHHNRNQMAGENPHIMLHQVGKPDPMDISDGLVPYSDTI